MTSSVPVSEASYTSIIMLTGLASRPGRTRSASGICLSGWCSSTVPLSRVGTLVVGRTEIPLDALWGYTGAHAMELLTVVCFVETKIISATPLARAHDTDVHKFCETYRMEVPERRAIFRASVLNKLWAFLPHAPVVSETTGVKFHPAESHAALLLSSLVFS